MISSYMLTYTLLLINTNSQVSIAKCMAVRQRWRIFSWRSQNHKSVVKGHSHSGITIIHTSDLIQLSMVVITKKGVTVKLIPAYIFVVVYAFFKNSFS